MYLSNKTIVITGAGSGIGAALARRFRRESPHGTVIADIDGDAASAIAAEVGGIPFQLDVADEAQVEALVATATAAFGSIDLMCLNAGIAIGGDMNVSNALWQRAWDVNVMSHVYGVRAVLPQMLERGTGYLLHTASAAGLLTNIGAAPYSVTKHAVVALAEWLSITYGSAGIKVSCLSPQFVDTAMLSVARQVSTGFADLVDATTITTPQLADDVVTGLADERFHILPHPEVAGFAAAKAKDPERWLAAMRDLQHDLGADPEPNSPS